MPNSALKPTVGSHSLAAAAHRGRWAAAIWKIGRPLPVFKRRSVSGGEWLLMAVSCPASRSARDPLPTFVDLNFQPPKLPVSGPTLSPKGMTIGAG